MTTTSIAVAYGAEKEDIRYDVLSAELGSQMPTGAGVRVGQIEAPTMAGNYVPSPAVPTFSEFLGKSFTIQSGASAVSTHARGVGQWFYGTSTSIAPGITQVEAFEVNDYLGDFLNAGSAASPVAPTARVYNHSWVGEADNDPANLEVLHRIDYLVENYDVVQVVGTNNGASATNYPLMSHAMNVIAVGRTDGAHTSVATDLNDPQDLYVAGRAMPHLVAPRTTTSHATALVSGAAAMLVEAAGASNGGKSEVIKASLMAGARREDVSSYVANTNNGLNQKFGAGELDVYNSYHIIAAGEQEGSSPSDPAATIGAFGFDYESAFDNSDEMFYQFSSASELAVTLAWNIDIAGDESTFDGTASLVNFDMYLYRLDGDDATLVASSTSTIDNTENLWLTDLDPAATYRIAIDRSDALGAHDYGLAWRLTVVPEPSSLALAIVASVAMFFFATSMKRPRK